jgi:cell division protein FtsN
VWGALTASNAARAAPHSRWRVSAPRHLENLKDVNQPKEPEDASKSTEEQRQLQEQLEHQDDDPDAPGLHQSHRDVADESTR